MNQTVSCADNPGYRAYGLTDFLLSVLWLSCHPSGNNIPKLWINTVTPGKLKDKLRGFHHLNLFKVLMHCWEIYIGQKLPKQSVMKMSSFIWVSKYDFPLKAEVWHQHLTLWLPLPLPGDSAVICKHKTLKSWFGRSWTCLCATYRPSFTEE